eukprot:jgi/Mesvir1/17383/Mv08684-RA.2
MFSLVSLIEKVTHLKRHATANADRLARQRSQASITLSNATFERSSGQICCPHCPCSCHQGQGQNGNAPTSLAEGDVARGLHISTANESNHRPRPSPSRLVDGAASRSSAEAPGAAPEAGDEADDSTTTATKKKTLRARAWEMFEEPSSSHLALAIYLVILCAIALSCTGFVMETLPEYDQLNVWNVIENVCVSLFTAELVCRFAVAPARMRFLIDVYNIIDFVAILPFYIELFAEVFSTAMMRSGQALGILGLFMMIALVLFSSIMYLLERGTWDEAQQAYIRHNGTPSPFFSIPETFYWCITTLTTVGYGDMYPITSLGKLVAGCTMISGLLILSLPISVVGANFAEVLAEHEDKGKKVEKQDDVQHTLAEIRRSLDLRPSIDTQQPHLSSLMNGCASCDPAFLEKQASAIGNSHMLPPAYAEGAFSSGAVVVSREQLVSLLVSLHSLTQQVEALMLVSHGPMKVGTGLPACADCWVAQGAEPSVGGTREGSQLPRVAEVRRGSDLAPLQPEEKDAAEVGTEAASVVRQRLRSVTFSDGGIEEVPSDRLPSHPVAADGMDADCADIVDAVRARSVLPVSAAPCLGDVSEANNVTKRGGDVSEAATG